MTNRVCPTCRETLPEEHFVDGRNPARLLKMCETCRAQRREYLRKFREAHPGYWSTAASPERAALHREACRKWYAEHAEERKEKSRKWYADHAEQVLESNRRRRAADPEKYREIARRSAQKARERKAAKEAI